MRMLLISDVHANICALEAIEKAEKWDVAYCCGDLVDYGPFAAETLRWVQEHDVHCVRGNHDAHVLGLTKADCERARNEGRWKWSHDNFEKIGEEGLAFLQSLPLTLRFSVDGVEYQMQHQYDQGYGTVESLDQFVGLFRSDKTEMLGIHRHSLLTIRIVLRKGPDVWHISAGRKYKQSGYENKRSHTI